MEMKHGMRRKNFTIDELRELIGDYTFRYEESDDVLSLLTLTNVDCRYAELDGETIINYEEDICCQEITIETENKSITFDFINENIEGYKVAIDGSEGFRNVVLTVDEEVIGLLSIALSEDECDIFSNAEECLRIRNMLNDLKEGLVDGSGGDYFLKTIRTLFRDEYGCVYINGYTSYGIGTFAMKESVLDSCLEYVNREIQTLKDNADTMDINKFTKKLWFLQELRVDIKDFISKNIFLLDIRNCKY